MKIEKALEEFDKFATSKGFSTEVGDHMSEYVVTTEDVREFLRSLLKKKAKKK
jgi:hypothetical protein